MPFIYPDFDYSGDGYTITTDLPQGARPTVTFQGKMRLEDSEDGPVTDLLARIAAEARGHDQIEIDLRQLEYINSRGISTLYKFAINLRSKNIGLNVLAVKKSTWQQATLSNIPKLSPGSKITWAEESGK